MLEDYFKKYPNMGRADQAQIKDLLREAGGSQEHVRMAIENEWPPAVFVEYLQTQVPQRSSLQRGRPAEVVNVRVIDEPEPEPARVSRRKTKGPGVFARIGRFFAKLKPKIGMSGFLRKGDPEDPPSEKEPVAKKPSFLRNKSVITALAVLAGFGALVLLWQLGLGQAVSNISFAPPTPAAVPLQLVGHPKAHIEIKSLDLWLIIFILLALLEAAARGEVIPIDFLSPIGITGVLIAGQLYGHDSPLFYIALGAAILGMIISTFYNPSEEGNEHWWDKLDTTHWYVAGFTLLLIYLGHRDWYPSYLPVIVPIIVAVVGIGKEFFRQLAFSLVATAVGIYPALVQTSGWISVGFAFEVVLAVIAHQQGWVTVRQTTHKLAVPAQVPVLGGRGLTLIIAWDLVLFYIVEIAIIGYLLYGNYPIAISR